MLGNTTLLVTQRIASILGARVLTRGAASLFLLAVSTGCSLGIDELAGDEPATPSEKAATVKQALPQPPTVKWPNSGGSMSVSQNSSGCLGTPCKLVANATATSAISLTGDKRTILPGANVTFGPYSLSLRNTGTTLARQSAVSHTYTITVIGSNPGLVAGPSPLQFQTLGSVTRTLTAQPNGGTASASVTIPVVMPSVFTDIQVIATLNPGPFGRPDYYVFPKTMSYPAGCGVLCKPDPASPTGQTCGPESYGLSTPTDKCLEAAVNPTGVLVPDVMPLSIVYEPSGNCSFSNLRFTSTVGTGLSVGASDSTATNKLWNYSAAGGIFSGSSNTTQTIENAATGTSTFSSTTTQAFGSSFGLPIESPGNPNCRSNTPVGDTSATNGPGVGDQFVFIVQPTFLYWDTAGRSSFRLSTQQAPGTVETIGTAFVRQIDPDFPSLAPSFMWRLTQPQLHAIRSLDPFAKVRTAWGAAPAPQTSNPVAASSGAELSPKRYVHLGRRCTSAGGGTQIIQGTTFDNATQTNFTNGMQTVTSSTENDGAKNASLVLGGFVGLITLATGGGATAFENFGKASSAFDKYVLHDETRTTVTQNVTTSRGSTRSSISSFAESFLIQDQTKETNVDLYYDTFYGTVAFNELSCCGAARTGVNANSCASYDYSTQCTVGGVTMHCCPEGTAMVGLHRDANIFKCAPLKQRSGQRFLDPGTQRNSMHVCPWGSVMVGLHADWNQLACEWIPGITDERVDYGTNDTVMHTCNWGKIDSAMSGVHLDWNQFSCASNPQVF
jgi:hypothetical protein